MLLLLLINNSNNNNNNRRMLNLPSDNFLLSKKVTSTQKHKIRYSEISLPIYSFICLIIFLLFPKCIFEIFLKLSSHSRGIYFENDVPSDLLPFICGVVYFIIDNLKQLTI